MIPYALLVAGLIPLFWSTIDRSITDLMLEDEEVDEVASFAFQTICWWLVIFPALILLWSTVLYYFRSFGTCSGEVLKNAGCALLMAFFYAAVLLFKVLCSMILAGPAGRELLSNGLMFVMAVCVWCDLGKLCRCTRTANNTPASIKEDIVDDLY